MTAIGIIGRYHEAFASGLRYTLLLASIAWIWGLVAGAFFGIIASRFRHTLGRLLRGFSFGLAAIPPIVLLYWAHYPLQEALGIVVDPFITASVIFSTINMVVVAEIFRNALDDFPNEFRVAAIVGGMTKKEILKHIELPIIFRKTVPSILASQVLVLQMTLFASLISVEELFRVSQRINSSIYRPIQIYTALAIFFLVVCAPLFGLAFSLRRRFAMDFSEK